MFRKATVKPHASQTIPKQWQPPGLYLVATPIGNLQDITLRALELLKVADLIVCEDTRVTGKLLSAYGIKAPMLSYNDHNAAERRGKILDAIDASKRVALVSDAGTPLVSDPGYKLVRDVLAKGHYVTTLPGASSVLCALSLSGLPCDRFFFAGFLPAKKEALKKTVASLAGIPSTLVFFESARRLNDTLSALASGLGNRQAAVVRELTKLHEETRRASLKELQEHYEQASEPKGEIVIVVSPPEETQAGDDDVEAKLRLLLRSHSVKEAASIVAEESGRPRKEIYSLALKLMQS